MCTTHMLLVCKQVRIGPGSLELELWIVVSHHVGPGNQTQDLCKSNKCSELLSHLSGPFLVFVYTKESEN